MKVINSTLEVLLIDDCQTNKPQVVKLLEDVKSDVINLFQYDNLEDGLLFLQRKQLDVVLLNLLSPDDYLEAIKKIQALDCQSLAIVAIVEELNSASRSLEADEYLIRREITRSLLENTIVFARRQKGYIQQLQQAKEKNYELNSRLIKNRGLFKSIVDNTSNMIWEIDLRENYTFLNQAWLSFTGQTLAAGLKDDWRSRIHPEDLAEFDRVYRSALEKKQGFQIEYRLKRFDGRYRNILNTAVPRYNLKQKLVGFLCSGSDFTRHMEIEQQLIRQSHKDRILAKIAQNIYSSLNINQILQTAANEINEFLLADTILITKVIENCRLKILYESSLAMSGSCELLPDRKLPDKELVDNFEALSAKAIIACNNTFKCQIINNGCLDFTLVPYSLLLVPIVFDEKLWGSICIEYNRDRKYWQPLEIEFLEQITIQLEIAVRQSLLYQKLEQANQELARQATIDGLTKVANRRQFDRYLALEWKRGAREKQPLSLILCDIDYFKLYNDTYGHQAGDRCLMEVAQTIAKVIKRPADLVARYGGEEFAVILPNTDLSGAKYLAQQIRARVEALEIEHDNSSVSYYITLSLGVTCCIPAGNLNFTTSIDAADTGLYRAKKSGRNRVCEFEIVQK